MDGADDVSSHPVASSFALLRHMIEPLRSDQSTYVRISWSDTFLESPLFKPGQGSLYRNYDDQVSITVFSPAHVTYFYFSFVFKQALVQEKARVISLRNPCAISRLSSDRLLLHPIPLSFYSIGLDNGSGRALAGDRKYANPTHNLQSHGGNATMA
ncbi:hypothetical protein BDR03DRAFT_967870 [Suillus americanus]|nr:hypothetical protein BDR03DRAFT_967870 [Suillus americanus]